MGCGQSPSQKSKCRSSSRKIVAIQHSASSDERENTFPLSLCQIGIKLKFVNSYIVPLCCITIANLTNAPLGYFISLIHIIIFVSPAYAKVIFVPRP